MDNLLFGRFRQLSRVRFAQPQQRLRLAMERAKFEDAP
jgi:hypothetical protein